MAPGPARPEGTEGVARAGDPAREDHDRRATGRLRRYLVSNRCDRLWTLTYARQTSDLARVKADTARFLRRLRSRYPEIAYARVFERHKSGNLHVHVAVNVGPLDKAWVERIWGQGFVDGRRLRAQGGTRPGREAARSAARYLGKYVAKDPVRDERGHRYEVRQGCQPGSRIVWVDGLDAAAALAMVCDSEGIDLAYSWTSSGEPDWNGPGVAFGSW